MEKSLVELRCACGSGEFVVRAKSTEAVGLASCDNGHHSLILDSRDTWFDVIQEGRPRQLRCRCKGERYRLSVQYSLRRDTSSVAGVSVYARCSACGATRDVFDAEIDYEPTEALVDRPLDPVEDPWLKARRVELTALWKVSDLTRVLRFAATLPEARICFGGWNEPISEVPVEHLCEQLKSARIFTVLIAREPFDVPASVRDVWRTTPVIHIGSPMHIHYATGREADLYYVTYALEDLRAGRVVRRSPEFLRFADTLRAWLSAEFCSKRGKRTVDSPSEYERCFG
jgi:hypothetical protein